MIKMNYQKPMSEFVELESADIVVTSRYSTDSLMALSTESTVESESTGDSPKALKGGVERIVDSHGNITGMRLT